MVIMGSDGYVQPTDGEVIRRFLRRARLTSRAAAQKLEIDERQLRDYCTRFHVPRYVMLAVESLARQEFEFHFFDGVYSTAVPGRLRFRHKPSNRRRPSAAGHRN